MSAQSPLLLLVDGHSLAFRSYYAFAKGREGGLRTSLGIPTSVCFGFLKSLLEVMAIQKPEYLAIAFDLGEPTFRHQADENYKADRAEAPEDLLIELKNLQELLTALNLQVVTSPGFEADDVIGTLARQGMGAGLRVKILSGDQDLFQLIDPQEQIRVLHLGHGKGSTPAEFGAAEVQVKLGITPQQVIDYKALCGDKSDQIPGVRGIGEKTAVKLLSEYGSLAEIYQNLDKIPAANQKKLQAGEADAKHSQYLATIIQNVPLNISLADCQLRGFNLEQVKPILQKLEFQSFVDQIDQIQQTFGGLLQVSNLSNIPSETDEDISFFTAADTQAAQAAKKLPIQPQIIQTVEQLEQLVTHLKTLTDPQMPVAWDTETTALDPRDAKLVGIGCCFGEAEDAVAYIPVGHTLGTQLELSQVLASLKPILSSSEYPKVFQNTKFDRLIFRVQGIELDGVVFDTLLASYLVQPEGKHNLKDLAYQYLGIISPTYQEVVGKGKTIADVPIAQVADYCGMDVYNTFHLVSKLRSALENTPAIYQLLLEVEQPLEKVLAEMEFQGIRINTEYLQGFSQQLEKTLTDLEKKAYTVAGEEFNLGSPKQLSALLFETLNLDVKKSRKIKTGYSTDAAVLEKLQGDHPVIDFILEHRTLSKLKSTYVDALPQLVRPDTQRVHTSFNQTVTATGRLSSSDPNLQNIPIRTEFSRQIRQAFIPEPGWILVSADYSQIELRILAHLSQEPVLMDAYHEGRDVHTLTAQLLFDKKEITPDERRLGKTINFGVIYGMGAQRFARSVGVSTAESKLFIERFNQKYAQVFAYLESVKREAVAKGYVETICGRRRYFQFEGESLRQLRGKDANSFDLSQLKKLGMLDAQALRGAANAPIQGSSADIIKIAMIKLQEILKDYQGRLLLQVHDELVLEMPPQEWEELQTRIKSTMENAVALSVPLLVEIHSGENWMEAK